MNDVYVVKYVVKSVVGGTALAVASRVATPVSPFLIDVNVLTRLLAFKALGMRVFSLGIFVALALCSGAAGSHRFW